MIDRVTKPFVNKQAGTVLGVGDDAALIDSGEYYTAISTDMLVEGVHFDLSYMPLKHLGYKSVVVNLSDIYAMNGIPQQITVSLAISNRFSLEAIEELYEGIKQACDFYGVDLIGGDTTSSLKGLYISITAIGKVRKGREAKRSGAKLGDLICVTGDLGAAYLGLQILEREKQVHMETGVQPELEKYEYVVGRQLKPEARFDIVGELAKAGVIPTSMIDISDGLASELKHICKQSGVGALIEEANIPVHHQAYELSTMEFGIDATTCALNGGEDYELLFTINPKDAEKLMPIMDVKIVGEIVPQEDGLKLQTKSGRLHDLLAQGWKHF